MPTTIECPNCLTPLRRPKPSDRAQDFYCPKGNCDARYRERSNPSLGFSVVCQMDEGRSNVLNAWFQAADGGITRLDLGNEDSSGRGCGGCGEKLHANLIELPDRAHRLCLSCLLIS